MASTAYNRAVERNENRLALLNEADDLVAIGILRSDDRDQIYQLDKARRLLEHLRASLIYERQYELSHRGKE
jgi:hypothetical protein